MIKDNVYQHVHLNNIFVWIQLQRNVLLHVVKMIQEKIMSGIKKIVNNFVHNKFLVMM